MTQSRRSRGPLALLLFALVAPLALAGCEEPAPRGAAGQPAARAPSSPQKAPSRDELRRLRELADAVVVGSVESADDTPSGVRYTVRVTEVLATHPGLEDRAATHPMAEGTTIVVKAFLYRQGQEGGEVGRLDELSRYLFFLSPADDAGQWLNLEDAAAYRLPEAQPTLEALRSLRDAPQGGASQGGAFTPHPGMRPAAPGPGAR
jgi:hypothetical protein